MSYKVGYWNTRGFVEPIILVLEYLQYPYERVKYEFDHAEQWFENDKKTLGFDFPNMAYLLCPNGQKFTQSITILRHLGREGGLFTAQTNDQITKLEEILDTVVDLRLGFALLCLNPNFSDMKNDYLSNLGGRFGPFEEWLAGGRKWLNGDNLFVGDFIFWSVLDYHECMEPTVLEAYPNVKRFKEEFASIPQIASYLASDKFKKFPVLIKQAYWGWSP